MRERLHAPEEEPARPGGQGVVSRRGERPGHSATTAHFQAAYPFLGQGGLGAPGVYIGTDAFGGAWAFDPWELYLRKAVRSPNMIVMGDIAYLKSTLIKTYLYRQFVFGRQFWILDVKGEYGPFAKALGYPTIRLEPGGEVRLNAIERRGGREGQLALLRAVAMSALHRDLGPEEDAALRVALDQVNEEAGSGEPSLRGMFDGPTSEGIDLDAGVVVLDLSAMRDSEALGVLMTCAGAWQVERPTLPRQRRERRGIAAGYRSTPSSLREKTGPLEQQFVEILDIAPPRRRATGLDDQDH